MHSYKVKELSLPSELCGATKSWAIGLAVINEISTRSPKMTAIGNFMMIYCESQPNDNYWFGYYGLSVYICFISIARSFIMNAEGSLHDVMCSTS